MPFCKRCHRFVFFKYFSLAEGGIICEICLCKERTDIIYEYIKKNPRFIDMVVDFFIKNNGEIKHNEFNEFHTLMTNEFDDDIEPLLLRDAIIRIYNEYKKEKGL